MVSYDFFLAHAGPDAAQAEQLYDLLSAETRVFLDTRSLLLGDDWDRALPEAQRASRVTVVLVSGSTDEAFYQREEIATAIAMARADTTKHRVVPVYLDIAPGDSVPYGLRLKQGLLVSGPITLTQIVERLLDLHCRLIGGMVKPATTDAAARAPGRGHAGSAAHPRLAEAERAATVGLTLNERRRAVEEALARVVPWVFRDPRIAVERLAKAKTALLSLDPLIADWSAVAMQETGQPMAYDLQQLDYALRIRQTAVAQKLSALEIVRTEDDAMQPCADLAEEATGLLDACTQAILYVT
jgi:TIR domain